MLKKHILALILAMFASAILSAERIHTLNGERFDGEIVSMARDHVVIQVKDGFRSRSVRINKSDIWMIEFNYPDPRLVDKYSGDFRRYWDARQDEQLKDEKRRMRIKTFTIHARVPWEDTGIVLERGQPFYFEVNGRIIVNGQTKRKIGPAGERGRDFNRLKAIPGEATGALIGRYGERDYFLIGENQDRFVSPARARLFLGINDAFFEDNEGFFTVTLYY